MVFAIFALINKVGIPTDSVLNIATVFSLGLSWSMRDWCEDSAHVRRAHSLLCEAVG